MAFPMHCFNSGNSDVIKIQVIKCSLISVQALTSRLISAYSQADRFLQNPGDCNRFFPMSLCGLCRDENLVPPDLITASYLYFLIQKVIA